MNETRQVTVWRALFDGECRQIEKSRESLLHSLRSGNYWYRADEEDRWTIEALEQVVPVAHGSRFIIDDEDNPERNLPHVAWDCPCCGLHHTTDENPIDSSHVWFCEFGKGIVLVVVDDP